MIKNQEYKNAALRALKGKWTPAVIATIVYLLIGLVIAGPYYYFQLQNPTVDPMLSLKASAYVLPLSLFIIVPLQIAFYYAFLKLYRNGDEKVMDNMFKDAFKPKYGRNILAMILMVILVGLGTLLLIVPGIILTLCYQILPFVLKDNPDLSAVQALKKSREMMRGHKFDLFWLELSFIGWAILAVLTFGIGVFWLEPYWMTTFAAFYQDVKDGTAGQPSEPVVVE
ncbi:MAG: DUF975 family protein [Bacteroidales bacterium]|nr:DUF975 family protein [Bacteroidales bacterium]